MEVSKKLLFIKENNDSYIMFLPSDMESAKTFRRELRLSLQQHLFTEDDASQIILASDEAVTNSISANLTCQSNENIICRWKIKNSTKFVLFIMDYGKGIKPNLSESECDGTCNFESYLDKIKSYQKMKLGYMPYSGKNKIHRNMGHGLKIIRKLMDTVKIWYHTDDDVSQVINDKEIFGSIMEMEFNAKKSSK
jgi:anti-sigma regulatory factor (Ser/Thr protein kinase)